MGVRAVIGLGSNLGNREKWLISAAKALEHLPRVEPQALSSAYLTEPMGPRQRKFLNAAMLVQAELQPSELMLALLGVEAGLGRRREAKNPKGPRNIDLDLLIFENCSLDSEVVTLPHPRLSERAFALIPLLELWPDATCPLNGKPYREVLATLPDQGIDPGHPIPKVVNRIDHPHTADLRFSVSASSLAATLELALLALIDIIVDREQVIEKERLLIETKGGDEVELLVGLLSELPYLLEAKDFVPRRASLLDLGRDRARVALYGERLRSQRQILQNIKAVTYHGASLERHRHKQRWTAQITIDI